MKQISLLLLWLTICSLSRAQSTVGLIAHWDLNSGTTDVSGHGHNGNPSNVIPAAGMDGEWATAIILME